MVTIEIAAELLPDLLELVHAGLGDPPDEVLSDEFAAWYARPEVRLARALSVVAAGAAS